MNMYQFIRTYLPWMFKSLFRMTIRGSENEPAEGGYLAISNHISYLDVFVTAVAVKRQIRFMAKKELFSVPVVGSFVKACGAFPVDRKGNAVAPIKKSIKLLEEGQVVGMFPQGHRYQGVKFDTTRDQIKSGAAMAVYHAKCPVLPMFVATKNDRVRLFRPIEVVVGKPIAYEEFGFEKGGTEEYSRAAQLMYERIAELAPTDRRS